MANKSIKITEVVTPTPKQSYEIFEMLQIAYDRKNQRYMKADTDQSVANELEIERWGWVTQIREQFFGPDGNEDDLISVNEIKDWLKKVDKQVYEIQVLLSNLEKSRSQANILLGKIKTSDNNKVA
jgi:hypothetical protein